MSWEDKHAMREGFWGHKEGEALPMPIPNKDTWTGQTDFLAKLDYLQRRIREQSVIGLVLAYRGMSTCRCCNESNGTETFQFNGWEWPSGFMHYVAEHNVRPSLAFQEMVLGKQIKDS